MSLLRATAIDLFRIAFFALCMVAFEAAYFYHMTPVHCGPANPPLMKGVSNS